MPKTSPFHQKNPNIVEEAFELKPLYKIVHGYIPFCLPEVGVPFLSRLGKGGEMCPVLPSCPCSTSVISRKLKS